jgi:hypothetical protein
METKDSYDTMVAEQAYQEYIASGKNHALFLNF